MATLTAHKIGLVALVGAGLLDLALINLAIGPRALAEQAAAAPVQVAALDRPPPVAAVAVPRPEPANRPVVVAPPRDPATLPAVEPPPSPPARLRAAPDPGPAHADAKIEHVYFDTMSKRLSATARATLGQIATRAGATAMIQIEGRTDYRGDETYNEELSRARADAAAEYLVARGIAAARIQREHLGKRAAAEAPDSELWRDRRVDVRIIQGGSE